MFAERPWTRSYAQTSQSLETIWPARRWEMGGQKRNRGFAFGYLAISLRFRVCHAKATKEWEGVKNGYALSLINTALKRDYHAGLF